MDGAERRAHRNGWNMTRHRRREEGKANLNPRRRRAEMRRLANGPNHREPLLFMDEKRWSEDIELTHRVLKMRNYEIPPQVFGEVIQAGLRIINPDENPDMKLQLKAANLLRQVVKDSLERELMQAEIEALKKEGNAEQVFVREDPGFFGNDAHQRLLETTDQNEGT